MSDKKELGKNFEKLAGIMADLRGEKGCPWDKEQTHKSIKKYLIEETYEVLETIDEDEPEKLKEELGDLLLQIMFHSQMADEDNKFNINDVVSGISEKLIRRHPHVFADVDCKTSEEVLNNWEKIKMLEKKHNNASILDGIPKNIPSLLRAHRVQERAARVGFDWTHINDVYNKLEEEMGEFKEACDSKDKEAILDELGDVFFSLVNIARFIEADPEEALHKTIKKFILRFKFIEEEIYSNKKEFEDYDLMQLEELWDKAKKSLYDRDHD